MVDLARIAGLSQLSPQGFLGSGFDPSQYDFSAYGALGDLKGNFLVPKKPPAGVDFGQYETGFRDFQNQLNLTPGPSGYVTYDNNIYTTLPSSPGGLPSPGSGAGYSLPGLSLKNELENKQFENYMQSIGNNSFNEFLNRPIEYATIPVAAEPISAPAPSQQFDFSQYGAGFRDYVQKNNLSGGGRMMMTLPGGLSLYNTGEIDAFGDYMKSIGAGDYYNQYNQSLPGPSASVSAFATPTPAPARAPVMQAPTPAPMPARAPVMQTPTPAPVAQTPLPIVQPSVNVQNTGDMKMAKPDSVMETITRTAPPAFAEPFLQYGMSEAYRQYMQGPQEYYPGETVVGFAPQTEQALRMREQQALAGTPVGTAAQQYATNVLGGTFLGGSPGLSEAINRALDPVQARTTSDLALRGRLGSGAAADVMTRALGDVAADIAYRDYGAERARQQQVLGFAPQLQQASYYDIGQLGAVGGAREQLAQQQLAEDIRRFQFEQQAPAQALAQYQAAISGYPGETQTGIEPYYEPSTGQTFLGGAAAGMSLAPEGAGTLERLLYGAGGGYLATR